jgi:hypothetical protein
VPRGDGEATSDITGENVGRPSSGACPTLRLFERQWQCSLGMPHMETLVERAPPAPLRRLRPSGFPTKD